MTDRATRMLRKMFGIEESQQEHAAGQYLVSWREFGERLAAAVGAEGWAVDASIAEDMNRHEFWTDATWVRRADAEALAAAAEVPGFVRWRRDADDRLMGEPADLFITVRAIENSIPPRQRDEDVPAGAANHVWAWRAALDRDMATSNFLLRVAYACRDWRPEAAAGELTPMTQVAGARIRRAVERGPAPAAPTHRPAAGPSP